jgi:hypothetical protein
MKKWVGSLGCLVLLLAGVAAAQVTVNIQLGEPPLFLMPPQLGVYTAVGVPHDLFYVGRTYYLYEAPHWYRAPHCRGPWQAVHADTLPAALRSHPHATLVRYRDDEYRAYLLDDAGYHGKRFRPDKEWKAERKAADKMARERHKAKRRYWKERRKQEHAAWQEEQKRVKEFRKHHGQHGYD